MILFDGKIYESIEQNRLLEELREKIPSILQREPLSPEIIIDAVDQLRTDTLAGKFDDLLADLPQDMVETYKKQAVTLLSREHLRMKVRTELGNTDEYITERLEGFSQIRVKKVPLGVIFHIAAGNMDFLPAYSLAEGLLTGNINILKLPSADNGLSLKLIMQFIEYQPLLKDYIYVFDTASSDIQGMRQMANLCNAISVWGSDMAIEAVRDSGHAQDGRTLQRDKRMGLRHGDRSRTRSGTHRRKAHRVGTEARILLCVQSGQDRHHCIRSHGAGKAHRFHQAAPLQQLSGHISRYG